MNRTYINEVQKEIGNTVKVQGFIENLRNSKYMAFIVLKISLASCRSRLKKRIILIWWAPSIS